MDLKLSISNVTVSTKMYNKRNDFDFDNVNFPYLDGDLPWRTSYGIHISQLIHFARASLNLSDFITKTYLYNFDPLKTHFYIVKLGFTGVYIIFLILLENIDCGYSLEPPRRGGSNEYPQSMF